ncbi:MAG: hypothetical protein ACPGJS_08845 [Flammeovirgaceae bacterium]
MDRIFILLLFVGASIALPAQKAIDQVYHLKSGQALRLDLKYAQKIKITAWNKSEVQLKASVMLNNNEGNEAWELKSKETANSLEIYSELDKEVMDKLWNTRYTKDKEGSWNENGPCWRSEITYELFVPKALNVSINTYSGDISLDGLSGEVYAKSLSGFVDMNWDASKGAAVTLKSISGEVYSNLAVDFYNKKENPYVGYALKGKFKGGGTHLHLESISNNVYLRKQ